MNPTPNRQEGAPDNVRNDPYPPPENDVMKKGIKMRTFDVWSENGNWVPTLSAQARAAGEQQCMCGCAPASTREGRDKP